MGSRLYSYQYDTSARKLNTERNAPKKKTPSKPKTKSKLSKDKIKAKETKVAKVNFTVILMLTLGCVLFIMYRSVKINESFAETQSLTQTISDLEKENSQISVNIQNALNLSNIENTATTELGMQKLTNKQTVYVSLDTKDYVEMNSENKVQEEENFFVKLWNKFCDLF